MITKNETTTTIQCDKCKREQHAPTGLHNDIFWDSGWALTRGRKYEHMCYNCLPKKTRQNIDAMKILFTR